MGKPERSSLFPPRTRQKVQTGFSQPWAKQRQCHQRLSISKAWTRSLSSLSSDWSEGFWPLHIITPCDCVLKSTCYCWTRRGFKDYLWSASFPGTANDEGISSHYELKIHFIQNPTALCAGLSTGYLWVISTSCFTFAGSPYRSPGGRAQHWTEIPWMHSQWV